MSAASASAGEGLPVPRRFDLIVIGVSCTEEIIGVSSLPALDSHREIEVLGRWRSVGGNGLNVAVNAARLGADVALISKVPNTIAGEVDAALDAAAVDGTFLVPEPCRPAPDVLLITDAVGDYSVLVSDRSGLAFTPEDIGARAPLNARYVHIDGFTLGALGTESQLRAGRRWIALANDSPAALSIDLNRAICDSQPRLVREIISQADILFANAYEAETVTGVADMEAATRKLVDAGARAVVVKNSADGLVCATSQSMERVPAFALPIADSVGAGDGVAAGTLYGLARGLPLAEAAGYGAAVAAIVCTGHGSQGAVIDSADITRLLKER